MQQYNKRNGVYTIPTLKPVVFLCPMHRIVGGAVVHGDAPGPFLQRPRRLHSSVLGLFLLRYSHSCHSSHYGRSVSLPARTATALVSGVNVFFIWFFFSFWKSVEILIFSFSMFDSILSHKVFRIFILSEHSSKTKFLYLEFAILKEEDN